MNAPAPTHVETYARWTFTYHVYPAAGPGLGFLADAYISEGGVVKRIYMCSRSRPAEVMRAKLRGWCMEWAMDEQDPSRVEQRRARAIAARIKAGLTGEKGVT